MVILRLNTFIQVAFQLPEMVTFCIQSDKILKLKTRSYKWNIFLREIISTKNILRCKLQHFLQTVIGMDHRHLHIQMNTLQSVLIPKDIEFGLFGGGEGSHFLNPFLRPRFLHSLPSCPHYLSFNANIPFNDEEQKYNESDRPRATIKPHQHYGKQSPKQEWQIEHQEKPGESKWRQAPLR